MHILVGALLPAREGQGFALAHRRWQFEDRVVILCIFVSSMLSLALIFGYREQIVTSVVLWTLATLVFCGGLSSGRGFVFGRLHLVCLLLVWSISFYTGIPVLWSGLALVGLSLKLCSPRQLSGWSTWSAITCRWHVRGDGACLKIKLARVLNECHTQRQGRSRDRRSLRLVLSNRRRRQRVWRHLAFSVGMHGRIHRSILRQARPARSRAAARVGVRREEKKRKIGQR